jgi:hypothetical protein
MSWDFGPTGNWGDYFRNVYRSFGVHECEPDWVKAQAILKAAIPGAIVEMEDIQQLSIRPLRSEIDSHLRRSESLYALSRINDFLISQGAAAVEEEDGAITRSRDVAKLAVRKSYFQELGFVAFERPDVFSPFHHEIVEVTQDNSIDAVLVEEVWWPGFMMGDLLFSRAGVHVRAPYPLIDRTTALGSSMHFTYEREPRRTYDRSHGWGSNSQWSTNMPLFYEDAGGLHCNWEGEIDFAATAFPLPEVDHASPSDLSYLNAAQLAEFVINRCLVRANSPTQEPYPSPDDVRMSLRSETSSRWPLPSDAVIMDPGK